METKSILLSVIIAAIIAVISFSAGRIYQWLITPNTPVKSQEPLEPEEEGLL